jgi:hypothetical protein
VGDLAVADLDAVDDGAVEQLADSWVGVTVGGGAVGGNRPAVSRIVRQSSKFAVRERRRDSRVLVRWLILVCSWRSRPRSMTSA